jgi:hypothetical protein
MVRNLIMAHDTLDAESRSFMITKGTGPQSEQIHMHCNEIDNPACSSDMRYSTLVWVGYEDRMTEPLSTQIIQHRHTTAANSAHIPSCFLLHRAESLLRTVGPAYLSIDREGVTAHQSLVVASIIEDSTKCQVKYQTTDGLQRQFMSGSLRSDTSMILMLAWRRYDAYFATSVQKIYASVNKYEPRALRVFPSKGEFEHAHGKIGDIVALDEVAQRAPPDWSFRPITCDCTSTCRLGKVGVLKRTHSCGSEHVIVNPTASEVSRYLRCTADQRRTSKRKAAASRRKNGLPICFHSLLVEIMPITSRSFSLS